MRIKQIIGCLVIIGVAYLFLTFASIKDSESGIATGNGVPNAASYEARLVDDRLRAAESQKQQLEAMRQQAISLELQLIENLQRHQSAATTHEEKNSCTEQILASVNRLKALDVDVVVEEVNHDE